MRYSEAVKYQGNSRDWRIAEEKMIRRGSVKGSSTADAGLQSCDSKIESARGGCSVSEGELILVNRQYPYRDGGKPELVSVRRGASVLLARRAAVSLFRLIGEIDGWNEITAVSGWRSMAEQQQIWDKSVIDDGIEFTKKYVAVPGHSEHQTGLAIDLGKTAEHIDFIRPDFPCSGICQTFRRHMAEFGFIERYPAGKESITGISHEPWHFRYVGIPHAEIMAESGMTLEEYHDFVKQYLWGESSLRRKSGGNACRKTFEISWLSSEALPAFLKSSRDGIGDSSPVSCKISGDNVSGFIITMEV